MTWDKGAPAGLSYYSGYFAIATMVKLAAISSKTLVITRGSSYRTRSAHLSPPDEDRPIPVAILVDPSEIASPKVPSPIWTQSLTDRFIRIRSVGGGGGGLMECVLVYAKTSGAVRNTIFLMYGVSREIRGRE